MQLLQKIKNRDATVGIIGLGYVGLPLVREFTRAGFNVIGFDVDKSKVETLKKGRSYIKHIPSNIIKDMQKNGKFRATDRFANLKNMDCIIICVPTPLNKFREPDLSYIIKTTEVIMKYQDKGQLIVLESTTYPGTTDEEMRTILEMDGLKAGKDFFLVYSPEREDPNNTHFTTSTIPKVVGGYTEKCLEHGIELYSAIVNEIVPVSSTRAAEATKLLENIYRSVNIALVNELKVLFDRMDIDVYEVINAAKTKPFGFQAFYPGPGLGGHCIPIDPFYLTWKAREYDFHTRFIELAGEVNTSMPYYVVEKIVRALNDRSKSIRTAKILILGLAYKKNVDDERESPSLKIIELLKKRGAHVEYNDPYISRMKKLRKYDYRMKSVSLTEKSLREYDCVVIATDHSNYDYEFIVRNSSLIVDTRNAVNGIKNNGNVVRA
jgi:UDP-N-acetyl-D-glucosamine dehydrogenase